ncbi:MAG: PduL/EutD family phosphate acyltransferase [Patescibacteria group bacterium]
MTKTVIAEISAKHIHLSQEDLAKLFGKNYKLKKFRALSEPTQFAAKEKVFILGAKKHLSLRIVGPARKKSQVELAMTDCIFLGIKPAIQLSEHVAKATLVIVQGPKGRVKVPAIVPWRHLHISLAQAKLWRLRAGQRISAIIPGQRAIEFKNIIVRPGPFVTRLHLDTDEGNAAGIKSGTKVKLSI